MDDRITTPPSETQQSYKLSELAELLDADEAQAQSWLSEEGAQPLSPEQPDEYPLDIYDRLRARQGGL
jgi:hypothetical protein